MKHHWIWITLLWGLLAAFVGCNQAQTKSPAAPVLNLTEAPLTDGQAVSLQEQALETAEGYRQYLQQFELPETKNIALSQQQVAELVEHFAAQGMTVIDGGHLQNMENADQARAFGRAVQAGEEAAVTIYQIYADGGFSKMELSSSAATSVRIAWDADLQPYIVSISKQDVLQLNYTEKGYLIYQLRVLDSVMDGPDYVPYQMIRVEPLDDQCRLLCQTYIRPAGYANSNLFLTDWSAENYGDLVWNDLFPICYFLQTGAMLTSHTQGGYMFSAEEGLLIPPEEYLRYMNCYFPISPEELTAASYCDAETGCYPTRIFTSGDMGYRLPVPEVVAWQADPDGTLTLTVEALDYELGTDCAFRHMVTVGPGENGTWNYLGNQLLRDEQTQLPVYKNTYATTG